VVPRPGHGEHHHPQFGDLGRPNTVKLEAADLAGKPKPALVACGNWAALVDRGLLTSRNREPRRPSWARRRGDASKIDKCGARNTLNKIPKLNAGVIRDLLRDY
jgi:hypothetical protein